MLPRTGGRSHHNERRPIDPAHDRSTIRNPMSERNDQSEPARLIPLRGLASHDLRLARVRNGKLLAIREELRARDVEPEESIALLIAETRILTLGLGIKTFARIARIHPNAAQNVERTDARPEHNSYARVHAAWRKLGVPEETRERLIGLLVPETDTEGRPLRDTVNGLYWTYYYRRGERAFASATRKATMHRRPLSYGTLWQRHAAGMVPDFSEVHATSELLGEDTHHATSVWTADKERQLRAQGGVHPLLVRLLTGLEAREVASMTTDRLKDLGASDKAAALLMQGRLAPVESVSDLIDWTIPLPDQAEFRTRWKEAWEEAEAKSFASAFECIRDRQGWTNRQLSSLLRSARAAMKGTPAIRTNDARSGHARDAKPSNDLRRMYRDHASSEKVPALAAIDLVTSNPHAIDEQDEDARRELIRLFHCGARHQLHGSGVADSPLRAERTLCGVSLGRLADAAGIDRKEIIAIEQGRKKVTVAKERALISLARSVPAALVEAVREAVRMLHAPVDAVPNVVSTLRRRLGSGIAVTERMRQSDDDLLRHPNTGNARYRLRALRSIEDGSLVPCWPVLRRMLEMESLQPGESLERDWYLRMAAYLAKLPNWCHPLPRALGMVVFHQAPSLTMFCEHQMGGMHPAMLVRNVHQLGGTGYDTTWPSVSRYLDGAGLAMDDPQRVFMELLFPHKDAIAGALRRRNARAVTTMVQEVLDQWKLLVWEGGGSAEEHIHKLGLTARERGTAATNI
ncbi:MAG: hypothetical protein Greene041619_1199 [Candidatus Peregrinibacteria bacterium Greene0416_19]|nr:MAG: hypothetical protein Greene041619_1199 [Candidatus Peregrinibacteria bacterium Greene0416_19]